MENHKPNIIAPLLLSSLPSVGLSGFFALAAITEGKTLIERILGILAIILGVANIASLFLIRHFRIDYLTAFSRSLMTFFGLLFLIPVFGLWGVSLGLYIGFSIICVLYSVLCVYMIARRVNRTLDEGLMQKVIENKPVQKEYCSERMQVILITLINPLIPFLPVIGYPLFLCGLFTAFFLS
ncbi:MAG: hypothetical protein J6A55_04975 [Oscillospiraceae bacterium]|nr:hypothetical protein [Oscillospiraceae bacterium]